ncbi:hypothetical protein DRO32_02090 [Candidatus Bathyarchaeota archaeon]|nr:MAG: hypothetical protein DRO32_02090 [Candidatus Bathyarchaeota archaeon]
MAGEEGVLSAIPGALRERIELVEEALEEAPSPFIYRMLMDEGTKHVIEEYVRRRSAMKAKRTSIGDMSSFLGVRKADRSLMGEMSHAFGSGALNVVGVDAGVNYLNLEIAYVPLCCAVAALCSSFDVVDYVPKAMTKVPFWDDEVYPEWRSLVIGYRLQFELVIDALRRWKPDVIFFDGPFLYSQLMRGRKGTPYWSEFERTLDEGVRALELCAREGVPVVGFVKRPEGCSVAKKLVRAGLLPRPMRDTVALKWMEPGTYLEPMRYVRRTTRPGPKEVPSRMAEEYFARAAEMGVDEEVVSIYFTYVNTGYSFPYKVELPAPFLDRMEEIVALILALRASRGIPFPIYASDSLTKMTNVTRDLFMLSLRARLADEVRKGRLSEEDVEMFLPRHGESYGLSEEELLPRLSRARRRYG